MMGTMPILLGAVKFFVTYMTLTCIERMLTPKDINIFLVPLTEKLLEMKTGVSFAVAN